MAEAVETWRTQQYASTLQALLQQKGSKLRELVTSGSYKGKAASPVEQIGAVSASDRTQRAQPVVWANPPSDRRWVYPIDKTWAAGYDNIDLLRLGLVDPKSATAEAGAMAFGRAIDDIIIDAMFADAKTGESGGTTTSFPSGQRVGVDVGGTGSGLNVAKLRAARKLFMANEVDLSAEMPVCVLTAVQHDNLLAEIEIISTDFNSKPVLTDGMISQFLGIRFVHCERLDVNGSSQRRVPIFVKGGLHLGVWQDVNTRVSQREDLVGAPWQVQINGTFGATRIEEKRVVEIVCAE